MAEDCDGSAEKILAEYEICVEFRLRSGDLAEFDKGRSDRNSVLQEGRALPGGAIEIFLLGAEHSVCPAEKFWSKFIVCVEFRLHSAKPAESRKT